MAAAYPHREDDSASSLYSQAPSYEESAYLEQHASALISELRSTEAKLAGSRKMVEELREAMEACEARMEGYRLRVQTVEVESEREAKARKEREELLVAQIDGLSNRYSSIRFPWPMGLGAWRLEGWGPKSSTSRVCRQKFNIG